MLRRFFIKRRSHYLFFLRISVFCGNSKTSLGGLYFRRHSNSVRFSVSACGEYGRVVSFARKTRLRSERRMVYLCVGDSLFMRYRRLNVAYFQRSSGGKAEFSACVRRFQRVLVLRLFQTQKCFRRGCSARDHGFVYTFLRDPERKKRQNGICALSGENAVAELSVCCHCCRKGLN